MNYIISYEATKKRAKKIETLFINQLLSSNSNDLEAV